MRTLITLVSLFVVGDWTIGGRAAEVGDVAPEFTCLDDQGELWNSRDHIGKWPLVIYFYPSDFAFCCTRQAIKYRDNQDKLAKQGLEVVGISGDTVKSHRLFKTAHGLEHALLCDAEGEIARQFGVPLRDGGKAITVGMKGQTVTLPRKFTAERWTFIIGTDGRILHREIGASPMNDSKMVLEFFRKLNSE